MKRNAFNEWPNESRNLLPKDGSSQGRAAAHSLFMRRVFGIQKTRAE